MTHSTSSAPWILTCHHCRRGWNAQVPAIDGIEERKCRTWGERSALMCLMDPSIGCSGAERPDDVLVTLGGSPETSRRVCAEQYLRWATLVG